MTNHPNRAGEYELTFWGGTREKYRRYHKTLDAARTEALRVLSEMSNRNAHPAIVYGPDLAKDGVTIL